VTLGKNARQATGNAILWRGVATMGLTAPSGNLATWKATLASWQKDAVFPIWIVAGTSQNVTEAL